MITKEMVERLAIAANGGSFPNEYAKKYAVDKVIEILFALNKEDIEAIIKEKQLTIKL